MQKSLKRGMKALALAGGASALLAGPALAATSPSIAVRPAMAPNIYGSPSWDAWKTNAITALQNGDADRGSGPARYRVTNVVSAHEWLVTGFPSWRGEASPADVFGSPFASELGQRLGLTWRVKAASGRHVNIANGVTYAYDASHADLADLNIDGTKSEYSDRVLGIDFGSDGKRGGGDDVVKQSGTGPVDEIVGVSPGNGYAAYCDSSCTYDQQQAAIADVTDYLGAYVGQTLTLSIKYGARTRTSTVTIKP